MTSTAFVGVTVIPMDRPGALPGQTVLTDGDRIAAVGPSAETDVPPGATVIDGSGRYLIPGLADMHVHLRMWDRDPAHLALYLAEGTTLIRSLSGSITNARWREKVQTGELVGPTILTSGPTIIAGVEGTDAELAELPIVQPGSVAEVVAEVRAQATGWADLVKVYDGLAPEVYLAAIETAKAEGMYVTGHLLDELSLEAIAAAGLDEVAHLDELNFRHWRGTPDQPDFTLDWDAIPTTAGLLADSGMTVVSNLSADESMAELLTDTEEVLGRPEYRVVRPEILEAWRRGRQTGIFKDQEPYRRDLELPFFKALQGGLRSAGVRVLVGSDTSPLVEGAVPSKIHRELELLVESGFSEAEALAAATVNAADVVADMGGDGEFGGIVPGQRADLLLLDGNPLDDIGQTRNRVGVMTRGSYHPQDRLDDLVDRYRSSHTPSGVGR